MKPLSERIKDARDRLDATYPGVLSSIRVKPCGNPQSGLIIVGDFPTTVEGITGAAMTGPTYEPVRDALEAYGALPLEAAYFTHVCQFVPANPNAGPTVARLRAFKPLVMEELRRIRPRAVVLLGSKCAAVISGKSDLKIAEHIGVQYKFRQLRGCEASVFVTYNPKALDRFFDESIHDSIMLSVQKAYLYATRA